MTREREPIDGLILAGGKSSRFGSDKASARLRGRPLLQWVLSAIEPVCRRIVIVKAQGQEVSFILTNCSTGNRKLTISKLVLAGDSRCVFSEPEIYPGKVVDPGDQITLRTVYKPTAIGEDHAALIIESDGQNYPKFVIPICGKVIAQPVPGTDAGAVVIVRLPLVRRRATGSSRRCRRRRRPWRLRRTRRRRSTPLCC